VTRFLSSAAVLSAAPGSARVVGGTGPLTLDAAICAPAATCACAPRDNLAVHRLLQRAPEGSALVVDAGGRTDGGYFGELAAIDAQARGIRGLVIDGSVRDGAALGTSGFPVFHAGFAAAACVKERVVSIDHPVRLGGVEVAPGDQVVADRDAVLVVPRAEWPAVEAAATEIEAREAELRALLRAGTRLADLIALPPQDRA
jgi:4-hydroxy-4-methyl-2-oxoglutarate aldolase